MNTDEKADKRNLRESVPSVDRDRLLIVFKCLTIPVH